MGNTLVLRARNRAHGEYAFSIPFQLRRTTVYKSKELRRKLSKALDFTPFELIELERELWTAVSPARHGFAQTLSVVGRFSAIHRRS